MNRVPPAPPATDPVAAAGVREGDGSRLESGNESGNGCRIPQARTLLGMLSRSHTRARKLEDTPVGRLLATGVGKRDGVFSTSLQVPEHARARIAASVSKRLFDVRDALRMPADCQRQRRPRGRDDGLQLDPMESRWVVRPGATAV